MESRRQFLRQTGAGVIGVGMFPRILLGQANLSNALTVDKKQLVAALGDTIIPTAQGYPGYKRLEQYGISDEVLRRLPGITQPEFNIFNAAAKEVLGKPFVDLTEEERTQFIEMVVASFPADSFADQDALQAKVGEGLGAKFDGKSIQTLQKVLRSVRSQVFGVFYQNFPENRVARDKNKIPILPPGDQHQIINPNTPDLVTGWDVGNFPGPLSWAEEEARRAKWMKIHWHSE